MIEFEAIKHTYKLDTKPIPAVSAILEVSGIVNLSSIPKHILNAKANIGTAVHLACEYDDKGILDESSLDPYLLGYLKGWRKFKEDHKLELSIAGLL